MSNHPLRMAALALALLSIGSALSAQAPGPMGPGRGPGPMGQGRGFKGLKLTEDQQAKVKAIHDGHQAALKAKGEAAATAHQAMREAVMDPATDTATLKTLHQKAAAAQFDLMLEHRAVRLEILPLLSAEQKARFEKGPMGAGPRGGRGMGHGAGPGFGPHPGMRPDCPMGKGA